MMELLGASGLVAFAIASVAIGVRRLAQGARTGRVPGLGLGSGFLVGALSWLAFPTTQVYAQSAREQL